MGIRTGSAAAAMLVCATSPLIAQTPNPDSLVNAFVERGNVRGWLPAQIFEDCSISEGWEATAFRLLQDADLSPDRLEDLTIAWTGSLKRCQNPELEDWFLARVDREVEHPNRWSLPLWLALARSESRAVQEHLFELMTDPGIPAEMRSRTGSTWISLIAGDQMLPAYMEAFRTGRVPREVSDGLTYVLLRDQPEAFLGALGGEIRRRPNLLSSQALWAAIETAPGRAPESA